MISVIIPAYNHENFIGKAIESVLDQTYEDLELLVIDDGSIDNTGAIVKGYDDPRLTYLYQENQDAFNTINRGLDLAEGKYIAILNSDDIYTLDRLERLVQAQKETGAQCLFTDITPIANNGDEFTDPEFGWNVWHRKNRNFYFSCGDLYTAFLKGNFLVTTSNFFMTAEAVQKTGRFCHLRYLHDYDYIFRMMLAHPQQVQYLDNDKLLYYRIHPGNTLGEGAVVGREQDQQVIRKYMLARLPEEMQKFAGAGSDRLIELEHELLEVRSALNNPAPIPGIKSQAAMLFQSIIKRFTGN